MFPMIQTSSLFSCRTGRLQRRRMTLPVIEDHPLTSLANLGRKYVRRLLVMAPSSQELEPPINPGRFTVTETDFSVLLSGRGELRRNVEC